MQTELDLTNSEVQNLKKSRSRWYPKGRGTSKESFSLDCQRSTSWQGVSNGTPAVVVVVVLIVVDDVAVFTFVGRVWCVKLRLASGTPA